MFIFGNLISAIASILKIVLNLYMWIVIISALISWVNPDPYNPIVRFLHSVTDPVLRPIRRRLGSSLGIDLSPMIVILIIIFLQKFVVDSMFHFALSMR